jgi:AraC family transcriptional regulator of adaptative response/methylated-DNA-[protein]-cysteine methyltransferase
MLEQLVASRFAFATDSARWRALCTRDARADGQFVYAVLTTGVYCRPTCASRRPRRENVTFHGAPSAAERAGYRPCKRCRPEGVSPRAARAGVLLEACRRLDQAEQVPRLAQLAHELGFSPYHFHRLFRATFGVTPKQYAEAARRRRVQSELERGGSVTHAIYAAGLGSSAPVYARGAAMLGMKPSEYRKGGAGTRVRYTITRSALGLLLVAATERGLCSVELGSERTALLDRLKQRFPKAAIARADDAMTTWVARIVAFVEQPRAGLELPLDVRGTAFQERVWRALREIPCGTTVSYAELARRVGAPGAARAVAGACARNPLALAIPCHRVVRSDGGISGYRWGVARKRALLERERKL